MNKILKTSIILCIILFQSTVEIFSQNLEMSSIEGYVTNTDTNEPAISCAVVIVELNLWTTTNDKGYYRIDHIPVGREYTISTSILGMEKFEKKILLSEKKVHKLNISIKPVSYEMDEIVVLAEEKSGLGSSSNIQKTAIEHLQPSSLKDIMQLLPGQISSNPDLSSAAKISIRDIGINTNSSLGTAIIVDGAPISNNANMQSISAGTGGVDVRQISTDNIESIEVIKGIASVAHGDMTSGGILVKTKSGATPLNAKITVNPNVKKMYLGQGFTLKNNLGAVNFDADYTSSIDNKITPYRGFDRISAQLGYSNTFMRQNRPLSFNIKGKYSQTVDLVKTDPDMIGVKEKLEDSEEGYNVNVYGKWGLKTKLVSNIDYNFSINTRKQETYRKEIVTLGYVQPISNARIDTVMQGEYAPAEYYSEMTIEGKPFDIFAKISGNTIIRRGEVMNKMLYGIDYRSNGNNGEGRKYDELRPPRMSGGDATRPRSYKDIPAMEQYSLFIEDNLTLPLKNTVLFVQAGLRYNNYQPENLFKSKLKTILEPRVNLKYCIAEKYSVFGGYGIQSKSPTISYLYPDVAYFDLNSFNYFSEDPFERLLLVSTRVLETTNENIEPIKVTKYEAGFEAEIKKFKFHVTGYYEEFENGLSFSNQYDFLEYYRWEQEDPNIIYQDGVPPVVDLTNPTRVDTFIAGYGQPVNNQTMIKKGLEYRIDIPKIKAIGTSFNINGGYLYTKSYTNQETQMLQYGDGATQLPYVGVYAAGSGTKRERFNSNIIAITHLPKLRLVFTTTLQIIWKNSYQRYLGGGQPWEYTGHNETLLVKAPIALIDKEGVRHEISKDEILDVKYHDYLHTYRSEYFLEESQPIHYQLNLKLSSEIGDKARVSFYANNITMHNPKYKSQRDNLYKFLNSPLYFGMELTLIL